MDRWAPELMRAVSLARPDFFEWTPERQLRFRTNPPEEDLEAIVRSLLGTMAKSERAAARLVALRQGRRLPPRFQSRLNHLLIPFTGIGEDLFTLDEGLPEYRSIIDYPTLRAYDEEDHFFQEAVRAEEFAGYVRQPYTGSLFAWARALVGGQVTYMTLSMAARHVAGHGSEAGNDEVEKLCDVRIDAGGQEPLLGSLRKRLWAYERERWPEVEAEWDGCGLSGAFSEDCSDEDPRLYWVFTDKRALEQVRFGTFMADCRAIERPFHELKVAADLEEARWRRFVVEQHQELLAEG